MTIVIELRNVWKTYMMGNTPIHALRGLSLAVQKGEFVAIQGPSGSGKSTAMSLIGCLDIPSKGTIFLDGQNIASLPESMLAQIRGRKIGFVFQKFNLLTNLTAEQNVILPMIFQKIGDREKRAHALLQQVGLDERMYHKPSELSGGQQQRVAIARALAVNPDVILADEPTGNLDSATGRQIMSLLSVLHRNHGKTIILVTHDDTLAQHAERIVSLQDGIAVKEWRRKK